MFHWCSVYWPLLWFLSSSPPFSPPCLLSSLLCSSHTFLFSFHMTLPINTYSLTLYLLLNTFHINLFSTFLPELLPSILLTFLNLNWTGLWLCHSDLTLSLPKPPPPFLLHPSSSWKQPPPPPSSNAGRSDLYLRLSSSSSSAPPLPVLCSAVSLSKDGHASKSLYPLRYVQSLLFYLYISLC